MNWHHIYDIDGWAFAMVCLAAIVLFVCNFSLLRSFHSLRRSFTTVERCNQAAATAYTQMSTVAASAIRGMEERDAAIVDLQVERAKLMTSWGLCPKCGASFDVETREVRD
jgi:hypothetical protein